MAFLLTALPSGQVEAVHGPQGYATSFPSAGQPLGCVAGRFLSMAMLPRPWSCLGRTAGPHEFVLNLCVTFENFLRLKSHAEVLRSVQDVTLLNKLHSSERVCASLAFGIMWLLHF